MEGSSKDSVVGPELYFLISKFLAISPLEETKQVLVRELERHKILPKRIDWRGVEHDQSFEELERKYPHIGPKHLLEICSRIGPILDKELPSSVSNLQSLLGAGRQSLLRSKDNIITYRSLLDYCTRLNGAPLPESIARKKEHNLTRVLVGREHGGPIVRRLAISSRSYEKLSLLRRTLGHLSAVYCVLFDRSGKYLLTGADDFLVKLWSTLDGRLLATFRGASSEITDIAINTDNTLIAAGSLDRILRVWDVRTTAPIALLSGHTGMITSVNFCPSPRGDMRYLVTTSTDGSVAFWPYCINNGRFVFQDKPIQYLEKLRPGQAQMICAAFSAGGIFLAAGSADHFVRVYLMGNDGPKRILETEAHSDTVDSIQWAHKGLRFISGGKDGTAYIWHFEAQQWRSMKLSMNTKLPGSVQSDSEEAKKLKVTMVSWDASDNYVMTAVNDFTIKVWSSKTGQLHKVLQGHTDELYVLESHPLDQHVLLSAGHDGQIFLWDIFTGRTINSFANHIEGQGNGGVFDAKWSPCGTMIGATDSHGHILLFGFGSGHERLKKLPTELFFHTDYRPLLRDSNFRVLDEQTQTMPHLMPPPFLVDIDGNPHPPALQRMVPGRENCPTDQLIPNIGPGNEGVMEVQSENTVSELDLLIEALANRQQGPNDRQNAGGGGNDRGNNNPSNPQPNQGNQEGGGNGNNPAVNRLGNLNSPRAPLANNRVGLRRSGDVEGVRQSSGNWHRNDASFKFRPRVFVKQMRQSRLYKIKCAIYALGTREMEFYKREMSRRPVMISTNNGGQGSPPGAIGRTRGTNRNRGGNQSSQGSSSYRTRSIRVMEPIQSEEEEEEQAESNSSESASDVSEDMALDTGSDSDSDSSEYSDWVADQLGPNLEPPKRARRKPVERPPVVAGRGPGSSSSQGGEVEIPQEVRPSEWLTEVIPRKAPYYPQMGDEIVYLRQGHQRYLDAVRTKNAYKTNDYSEPWAKLTLKDHEFVKVIGIKYELRPPRLCCLKLAQMNADGSLGRAFTIKYHDMPDVLDFLVLRQTYEMAVSRNWQPGDRFRCMIDDGWWIGAIESRTAISEEFPDSLFMCFRVRWDNEEYEYMSPWDMEPVDENRLPSETGGAVPVLPEELRATLYQPKAEEWWRGDREAACRQICAGLEQVMGLPFAEPFLAPVDLNRYPSYAYVIEYPIDLTTIKMRFENHFYRRITSAQFDVRYLARNAEKYNEANSEIVKHARVLTELCLRVIRDPDEIEIGAVFNQLFEAYRWSDSEQDPTGQPSSSRTAQPRSQRLSARQARRLQRDPFDWQQECRELLELLWQCDDSSPFREPVDIIEHPDYHQIIDTPMDLLTIKEDLLGGNYQSPADFVKDVRLIFQNSRNYNTNKRSRIYSMTLRLSNLFESHIRPIFANWKASKRSRNRRGGEGSPGAAAGDSRRAGEEGTGGGGGGGGSSGPADPNQPGTSKMVTRRTAATNGTRRALASSSDDDDDDSLHVQASTSSSTRNGTRMAAVGASLSSYGNGNGVSSSSMAGPSSTAYRRGARDPLEGPSSSSSRPTRSSRPTIENGGGRHENGRSSQETRSLRIRHEPERRAGRADRNNSEDSSNSSSDTSDSDGSNGIPLAELGNTRRARNYDSEESYKPSGRLGRNGGTASTGGRAKKAKKKKSSRQASSQASMASQSRRTRRRGRNDDEDEEEDDEESYNRNGQEEEDEEEAEVDVEEEQESDQPADVEEEDDDDDAVLRPPKRRRDGLRGTSNTNRASVRRRHGDEDDDSEEASSDEGFNRKRRKRSRYESDQSFQLEVPAASSRASRRARVLGSESADDVSRPTRRTRRRTNAAWVNGDEEDEEEVEDVEVRPSRRAAAPAASSDTAASSQRRSNRTRVSRIHDSEEEEEDDEEDEALRPQRSQPTRASSRWAGSSAAVGASSSSSTRAVAAATTSGRFRTRQRAMFDEDEDEDDDREHRRGGGNRRVANVGGGIGTRRRTNHRDDEEEEDDDEEEEEEEDDHEEEDEDEEESGSDGRPRRRTHRNRGATTDNLLNSSRNRNSLRTRSGRVNNNQNNERDPLLLEGPSTSGGNSRSERMGRRLLNEVVSSSAGLLAPPHEVDHNYLQPERHATRRQLSRHQRNPEELDLPSNSIAQQSRLRSTTATETIVQRRNYMSRTTMSSTTQRVIQEAPQEALNNGNELTSSPRLRSAQSRRPEASFGPSSSRGNDSASSNRARKVRRVMDYNEDSDVEEENHRSRGQRSSRRTIERNGGGETSENEDEDDEEEEEPSVSVSSRGRIRKIHPSARRLFRE